MNHLSEEQLIEACYSASFSDLKSHLGVCPECAALYRNISETLDTARDSPVPHRGDEYGSDVWSRLAPNLASQQGRKRWVALWLLGPAVAASLIVLYIGVPASKTAPPAPPKVATYRPASELQLPAPVYLPKQRMNPAHQLPHRMPTPVVPNFMPSGPLSNQTRTLQVIGTVPSDVLNSDETDALLDLLKRQKNPEQRVSTVTSLATVPGGAALLTTVYRTDSNAQVRTAVLNALTNAQNRQALLELANRERNPRRRIEIQIRLDKLGSKP